MDQDTKSSVVEVISGPSFSQGRPSRQALDSFSAHFRNGCSRQLFHYWLSKCDAQNIPCRPDIQPVQMKSLLSKLTLWDYVPEKETARLRLVGTELDHMLPVKPQGRLLADVVPEDWMAVMRTQRHAFYKKRCPVYFILSLAPFGRAHVQYELLCLPLRKIGPETAMGIGLLDRLALQKAA